MEISKFGENKKILIVDDDKDLREVIAYDFKKRGFEIFLAENGNSAEQVLKDEKIDVLISDIQMPDCDGLCLLKKIKMMTAPKPIFLMMSGFTNYKKEDIESMGALALIPKPINRKEMLSLIENALKA